MKLSTKGRYAVMALADMTLDKTGRPLSLGEISARQGISLVYLEQLFLKLRHQGIVEASRGAKGGYRLRRLASQVSVRQIMEAVNEPIQTVRCQSKSEGCMQGKKCQTHDLWAALEGHISQYLDSVTLQDICDANVQRTLFGEMPSSSEKIEKEGVYLDYNATAPLRPEALDAMMKVARKVGNGSSIHFFGRQIRKDVEEARDLMAEALEVAPSQIIFTSGGTESNRAALGSLLESYPTSPVFLSSIEHDSVRVIGKESGVQGRLQWIPVTEQGVVDLEAFHALLSQGGEKPLVSVMYANNETGVIQPMESLAQMVHERGGILHCDGVQALGKVPLSFPKMGVDLLSVSSHKIGGPKGVGALIVRENLLFKPLLSGGGQERNRRAGTENAPGIVGFAAALKAALQDDQEEIRKMRSVLESLLKETSPEVRIWGESTPRLAHTLCVSMPFVKNETQVMGLDLAGFAVSAGAACSSGKVKTSHVLQAMGVPSPVAETAIRISLGWGTTWEEIYAFAVAWKDLYQTHQRRVS